MIEPGTRNSLVRTGNETLDRFLGGGFFNSSLNLFERQGPSSRLLEAIWNCSLAATTLASKNNLIFINFNTSIDLDPQKLLKSFPLPRKVKTEMLFKDIRGKSASAKIKIAWRYSNTSINSPSDNIPRADQIDFGISLGKEATSNELGDLRVMNIKDDFNFKTFVCALEEIVKELKKKNAAINIIIRDLLHPFSPMVDNATKLCKFMYILRALARSLDKGAMLVSYDINMCSEHSQIKQRLYNMADCAVSFYSYETGENRLTGYKNTDGTLEYIKVPKINSFGPHFQRELSDWGYRLTKNHRFLVIDELSLPPCHDDEDDRMKKKTAEDITKIENKRKPLIQVSPLEDFREVAEDVLAKKL